MEVKDSCDAHVGCPHFYGGSSHLSRVHGSLCSSTLLLPTMHCVLCCVLQVTRLCYEVKEADVARARNQLKASLLFMQDSNQRKWKGWLDEAMCGRLGMYDRQMHV